MIGIDSAKLLVLAVLAGFLLGPTRLTAASAWLGRMVRQVRDLTEQAKDRAKRELGDDFDEWKSLDPRRYDPRRIIADALLAPPEHSDRRGEATGRSAANAEEEAMVHDGRGVE